MPFTLAHPAIVVPLARLWGDPVVLPTLVVGAMSPDFEYFVFLQPRRTIGHDLAGIPLMCVPASLTVLWLFDRWMKGPLIQIAPRPLRLRLMAHAAPNLVGPRAWLVAAACAAVGALSHIAWDGFTHGDGVFVRLVPPLGTTIAAGPPAWRVLQHASTVVGLGLLAFWSARWLAQQPDAGVDLPSRLTERSRAALLAVLVVASCACGAIGCRPPENTDRGGYAIVVRFVIATIASGFVLALVYSLVARWLDRPGPIDSRS
jgi:hypothetical protein